MDRGSERVKFYSGGYIAQGDTLKFEVQGLGVSKSIQSAALGGSRGDERGMNPPPGGGPTYGVWEVVTSFNKVWGVALAH